MVPLSESGSDSESVGVKVVVGWEAEPSLVAWTGGATCGSAVGFVDVVVSGQGGFERRRVQRQQQR